MWNAHFASRASLTGDSYRNANGIAADDKTAISAFEAARKDAIAQAGKIDGDVAVTIIADDEGNVTTTVEPVVADADPADVVAADAVADPLEG